MDNPIDPEVIKQIERLLKHREEKAAREGAIIMWWLRYFWDPVDHMRDTMWVGLTTHGHSQWMWMVEQCRNLHHAIKRHPALRLYADD